MTILEQKIEAVAIVAERLAVEAQLHRGEELGAIPALLDVLLLQIDEARAEAAELTRPRPSDR